MKPIKIEHTKTHVAIPQGKSMYHDVLVAPATLVLVECKRDEAQLYWFNKGNNPMQLVANLFTGNGGKYYKLICISKTEKIEVGVDWAFCAATKEIGKTFNGMINFHKGFYKILALPEHFSPELLQMIVDGKLKDGMTILLETQSLIVDQTEDGEDIWSRQQYIKLNPHITIYPVEEKMYSRKDFDRFCEWIDEWWRRGRSKKGSGWFHVGDFYKQDKPIKTKDLAKEWFEQNVK